MCKSTISLLELFQRFPDQDSARTFMEQQRWPNGVSCPHCQERERIGTRKGGYYRCNDKRSKNARLTIATLPNPYF